jgi:RNA polymerase sigma factor (TIGR02999 family)
MEAGGHDLLVSRSTVDVRPITLALERAAKGEPGADEVLWDLVYSDLKQLAASRLRGLQPGQTLHATALVHEAWMRLSEAGTPAWESRAHFFGAAARSMRNILVDQARRKRSLKRGGAERPQALSTDLVAGEEGLDVDLLALDEALDALGAQYERPARIVMLRFFAGLSIEEIAEMLEITSRTVDRDLLFARTWLRRFLDRT